MDNDLPKPIALSVSPTGLDSSFTLSKKAMTIPPNKDEDYDNDYN